MGLLWLLYPKLQAWLRRPLQARPFALAAGAAIACQLPMVLAFFAGCVAPGLGKPYFVSEAASLVGYHFPPLRLADFVLGMALWGLLFITTTQTEILEDVYTGLAYLAPLIAVLLLGAYILAHRQHVPVLSRVTAVRDKLQNLMHGLQPLKHASGYFRLGGSTLLLWLLNCLAMWAILKGLGVSLSPNQTVLLIGITGISMAIPSAPAGIGTLQYAFHLFAQLLGISASVALAASVIVQVVLLGSATVVGAIAYSYAVSTHLLRRPGES